jgi:hypothetical protein
VLVTDPAPTLVSAIDYCGLEGFYSPPLEHFLDEVNEPFSVREIEGLITSVSGDWPPGGVLFQVKEPGAQEVEFETRTDVKGRFVLKESRPGIFCFKATIEGWSSTFGVVQVSPKAPSENQILLKLDLE